MYGKLRLSWIKHIEGRDIICAINMYIYVYICVYIYNIFRDAHGVDTLRAIANDKLR